MIVWLLPACQPEANGPVKYARAWVDAPPSDDSADTAMDSTDSDSANGDSTDTADASETDDPVETADSDDPPVDTGEPSTDACWLGEHRDYTACAPTFAYDGSFGADYVYPSPYGGSPQYLAPARFVDLEALDPDVYIAPNFVVSEYMEAYKGRWAVLQGHHAEELQAIRDTIGGPLTITSGYRSPGYNAEIGGVTYSRHQYGDASDLDASGWSVEDLGVVCDDLGASYVGLYEDGHTHCDWRNVALDTAFWPSSMTYTPAPPPVHHGELRHVGPQWWTTADGFDEGEPLRHWYAYDRDGGLLMSEVGRSFGAPEGTARIRVHVGGQLWLDASL